MGVGNGVDGCNGRLDSGMLGVLDGGTYTAFLSPKFFSSSARSFDSWLFIGSSLKMDIPLDEEIEN